MSQATAVNSNLNLNGDRFTFTTCTFSGQMNNRWIRDGGFDIVFCREVTQAKLENLEEDYESILGSNVPGHITAVLVKRNRFDQQIERLPTDHALAEANWRFCPVKLNNMIVVAWDGRSRNQGRHTADEKKEICLNQLRRYALSLVDNLDKPVIIGGAFQLDAEVRCEIEDDLSENYIYKCSTDVNKPNNTDYYYGMAKQQEGLIFELSEQA
ncbi:uncharacterized protein [Antedon mediterranea]|uniref:uncharacterized protein n=1 Tax=Antedon mediterranea TaxID=105859 RepID=UPI003AF57506